MAVTTKRGNPITGSRTAMQSRPPVRSTPNTSRDAQKQVRQPPQPFANARGAAKTVANTNRNFAKTNTAGRPAKNLHGGSSRAAHNVTDFSIHNGTSLPKGFAEAVGYKARDTKGINPIHSGFRISKGKR